MRRNIQLRGIALENFLTSQLRAWWGACAESGVPFVYSQLEFSRKVGVSRETVRKKQAILDVVLAELSANRRTLSPDKSRQKYIAEIEKLNAELLVLRGKYKALQSLHVEIFSALLLRGVDLKEFVLKDNVVGYRGEV